MKRPVVVASDPPVLVVGTPIYAYRPLYAVRPVYAYRPLYGYRPVFAYRPFRYGYRGFYGPRAYGPLYGARY